MLICLHGTWRHHREVIEVSLFSFKVSSIILIVMLIRLKTLRLLIIILRQLEMLEISF